jgi:hypothetical protein
LKNEATKFKAKHSSAIIAADVKRFGHKFNADEVFGTHRSGIWTAPSAAASDKPIFGVTVADLGRDGMLTLSTLYGSAWARLTTRGNWFARTVVTEMAEGGSVI